MLFELIKAMGIVTYVCLWITAILGFSLWKLRILRVRPWMHFLMGGITLLSATIHLALVLSAD